MLIESHLSNVLDDDDGDLPTLHRARRVACSPAPAPSQQATRLPSKAAQQGCPNRTRRRHLRSGGSCKFAWSSRWVSCMHARAISPADFSFWRGSDVAALARLVGRPIPWESGQVTGRS